MLTGRAVPPPYRLVKRLEEPLTTWRHLAIIVKHYLISGVATTVPDATIDFNRIYYVGLFPREVDEYSRGRCAVEQTIVVPVVAQRLVSRTSIGGGNYYIHPTDLKNAGIWTTHACATYDSIAVYTDDTAVPTPAYFGNTTGYWAPTADPGVSSMDIKAPSVPLADLANEGGQLHEWLHQVEHWHRTINGRTVPDLHDAGSRTDRRTGVAYASPWWNWYQDFMTAKITTGADLPGITDAVWASGRPVT